MKLQVPLTRYEEIEPLIKAGADEFYAGVHTTNWTKSYTHLFSINRRDYSFANIKSYDELKKCIDAVTSFGKRIHLTINSFYSKHQYEKVLGEIDQAINIGINDFVVGDLGLILELNKRNVDINIHLSTMASVLNSMTAKFYKRKGIKQMVLDRQLSIDEISRIVSSNKDVEFAVFIIGHYCMNIDSLCRFCHGFGESKNSCLANTSYIPLYKENKAPLMLNKLNEKSCGACAIPKFMEAGIARLKIIGRHENLETKERYTKIIKEVMNSSKQNRNMTSQDITKIFEKHSEGPCSKSMCFY